MLASVPSFTGSYFHHCHVTKYKTFGSFWFISLIIIEVLMCINYCQLILFVISMQYSGECAHVLENDDSMVTACAFSGDSSLLATGITDSYGSKSLMSLCLASNYFVHCCLLK